MNNARFSTSIHILTLLQEAGTELVSSDYLAGSININPAIVRKEISNLKKYGFIDSKEGKNGGSMLAIPARNILLSDVYKAVRSGSLLGAAKNNPNPYCKVGKQINQHIDKLFEDAETALVERLGKTTLAEFASRFT
jgi:DNA-binding IscR family transcriptional regulator